MQRLLVDANVLLRLITDDPPELAQRVANLVRRAEEGQAVLQVNVLVVAEMTWVLVSYYGYSREQVAETLLSLLSADGLELEDDRLVLSAVAAMARANVDFVDAYLAELSRARNLPVASFDADFKRLGVEWVLPE
jgi:predicted nucleic acid-binding protein